MRSIDSELKQLHIGLLQLQRSALIDTQTIMQILVDTGICTTDDIVNVRQKVEDSSPEVKRIDSEIIEYGGDVIKTPLSESQQAKEDQMAVLADLLNQLVAETGGTSNDKIN